MWKIFLHKQGSCWHRRLGKLHRAARIHYFQSDQSSYQRFRQRQHRGHFLSGLIRGKTSHNVYGPMYFTYISSADLQWAYVWTSEDYQPPCHFKLIFCFTLYEIIATTDVVQHSRQKCKIYLVKIRTSRTSCTDRLLQSDYT